jgi:hemerythrin
MLSSLRKIELTNGLSWVEIPELGFHLLCGCPADSVKHLMRRGLIQSLEVNGVKFETGPQAILLSDLAVQNGQFSNMSEFPVLQMMYRQGMILPNHPGNTGKKPMLIGSQEQISNQMQYIYRGNYGLVSPEEMTETGVSAEEAERMMAIKLKFAFGKIKHPSDLLSTVILDNKVVELMPGLTILRLRTNIFQLCYGDEQVVIDLNLLPSQSYKIPYALHHHSIKREYFSVIHSGEGDGWDIHRPSMSSIVVFQGKYFLIDAGPNIHHILNHLGIGINEIFGIFHTHSHDDHFAGLTTLMRTDHRIRYYATPLVRSCVTKKLTALLSMDEDDFHHYFDAVDLISGEWNNIEGLDVCPIFSPHPVETTIFEFRALWKNGYLTFSHLADITSRKVLEGMIDGKLITKDWVDLIYSSYLHPTDLKKLDIGGGMIHGVASDFKNDESVKIILSHTALELTTEQMEIGSGAPFGTTDVLIKSSHDVLVPQSINYLETYFPEAPRHEIRMLLNFPIISFNPQTIILKGGIANEFIYLVLTGNVDMIDADTGLYSTLSSGAILGEFSGMAGVSMEETYRAQSFVQALQIPGQLYYEFVKRNNLYRSIEELADKRWFLQRTWLFGESISTPIHNSIAKQSIEKSIPVGPVDMMDAQDYLYIILSGEVTLRLKDRVYRKLGVGDFFGEGMSLFRSPPLTDIYADTPVEVFLIPRTLISQIPIVRFKLHETYEMKVSFLMNSGWDHSRLELVEGHEVGHHQIDLLHRKLHIMSMRVVDLVGNGCSKEFILLALNFIAQSSERHFKQEEHLMEIYQLPRLEEHCLAHEYLLKQLSQHMNENDPILSDETAALKFFRTWLLSHHEAFDCQLAKELNARGVY